MSSSNRKLEISTAPTKAKSWEPAYSQALNQTKIDRHGVKIQSQAGGIQSDGYGGWCFVKATRDVGEEDK